MSYCDALFDNGQDGRLIDHILESLNSFSKKDNGNCTRYVVLFCPLLFTHCFFTFIIKLLNYFIPNFRYRHNTRIKSFKKLKIVILLSILINLLFHILISSFLIYEKRKKFQLEFHHQLFFNIIVFQTLIWLFLFISAIFQYYFIEVERKELSLYCQWNFFDVYLNSLLLVISVYVVVASLFIQFKVNYSYQNYYYIINYFITIFYSITNIIFLFKHQTLKYEIPIKLNSREEQSFGNSHQFNFLFNWMSEYVKQITNNFYFNRSITIESTLANRSADQFSSFFIGSEFEEILLKFHYKSLWKQLFIYISPFYLLLGIIKLLSDVALFFVPILLNLLLQSISNKDSSINYILIISVLMIFANILNTILTSRFDWNIKLIELKIRSVLISILFRHQILTSSIRQSLNNGKIFENLLSENEKEISNNSSSSNNYNLLNEYHSSSQSFECEGNGSNDGNMENKKSTSYIDEISSMNLMTIDIDRIRNIFPSFHLLWSLPFQISISLYLLYRQLSFSFIGGLIFSLLMLPLNKLLAYFIQKMSKKQMEWKDKRVNLLTEMVDGWKLIRFNLEWKEEFLRRVEIARKNELFYLKMKKYLDACCVFFWASTPVIVSLLSFILYVQLGHQLTIAKVFTCITLFQTLIAPLNMFPWVINGMIDGVVSLKRFEYFLSNSKVKDFSLIFSKLDEIDQRCLNVQENSKFYFHSNHQSSIIRTLTEIDVYLNDIILIRSSSTGGGVTSFFLSLLGEMEQNSLIHFQQPNHLLQFPFYYYLSQELWCTSDERIEDILLKFSYSSIDHEMIGLDNRQVLYNLNRYRYRWKRKIINLKIMKQVLDIVHLTNELISDNKFESEDEEFEFLKNLNVGQHMMKLSGGQQARLSLARLLYGIFYDDLIFDQFLYPYRILLLDDGIFNSLDKDVCGRIVRSLFDVLLHQLKVRPIILINVKKEHLIQQYINRIMYIDNSGNISMKKTICQSSTKLLEVDDGNDKKVNSEFSNSSENHQNFNLKNWKIQKNNFDHISSFDHAETIHGDKFEDNKNYEMNKVGKLSLKIWWLYFKCLSYRWTFILFISMTVMQIMRNGTDYFLSYYLTHQNEMRIKRFLMFYGIFGSSAAIFTIIRAFSFAYAGIIGARYIHKNLLISYMKTEIKQLERIPSEFIMNRFTADISTTDDSLPFILNILLANIFSLIGTSIIIIYSFPLISIIIVPLIHIYFNIQRYYRWTSRELKRLCSERITPLYSMMNDINSGMQSLRIAHRQIYENFHKLLLLIDESQCAEYYSIALSLWFSIRLQLISLTIIISICLLLILEHWLFSSSVVLASKLGLALSYSLGLTNLLNGFVTSFSEVEKELISMERIVTYINQLFVKEIENIDHDDHLILESPNSNFLKFSNVNYCYDGEFNVLKDLTFTINKNDNLVIIGRTGSGKSSICSAILRCRELESGMIELNGMNIKEMRLDDLRKSIRLIPQYPKIFSGTIQENISLQCNWTHEMFEEFVRLRELFNFTLNLDYVINSSTANISIGEKQLINIIREMFNFQFGERSMMICFDEITSHLPQNIEKKIINEIQNVFSQSTIIFIIHRIESIIDWDVNGNITSIFQHLLQMENGSLRQFSGTIEFYNNHRHLFEK
ncbi:hypothetical protein SNEBB_001528 [Seison nebaliae]|nr:hypothetical protein SNEBB_001528 [Seison nebaliae]